ncbi:MAG: HAMP domain-containing histidine kinase [Ktedonobacteraceae bacterium]|nr:HAMP domain-containing histidine kinase [Ktedonobacteraceae bacterium]
MPPQEGKLEPSNMNIPQTHPRLVSPTTGKLVEYSPLTKEGGSSRNAPPWLRPFFSLRVQLLFAYCLVLIMAVILVCMLTYQQTSSLSIALIALGVVAIGSLLALFFTTILLRPLWRVTDAAQAIAVGDLKQRNRLPLRLPPQDEIDRLAGSINEMVTRLEHAEEMQRASEQRFQRFFSDASHQLRTPLTSIRGFTEVLMRGAKDDPETALRVLKRMKSESERMTYLINDLLTLSRLDEHTVLKKQYVNLVGLATENIEEAKKRVSNGRTITLSITTQENLGLQGDRERLKQLLFVLLDNALKHGRTDAEGIITLQLDRKDNEAIIHVIDNGNGITKEDQAHIFDSFYRGRQTSPSSNGTTVVGTGLGLTIAAAIVRAHQGTISVTSEPGKGTDFTLTLPCID